MDLDGFMTRTVRVGDCLIWTGAQTISGRWIYGVVRSSDGRRIRAHRWIYEQLVGPIPDDLLLRHSCDTPLCVSVEHLTPGTDADNARDREERGRNPYKKRTKCPRGHNYTPENTRWSKAGTRSCRKCHDEGVYLTSRKKEKQDATTPHSRRVPSGR